MKKSFNKKMGETLADSKNRRTFASLLKKSTSLKEVLERRQSGRLRRS
jgi:hypothetical protein